MRQEAAKSPKTLRAFTIATIALTMGAFGVMTATPAFAATSTVCASGCDFTTIQAAVNSASDGDTLSIGAGTYAESVTIDKSLTLLGPNASISPNTPNPLVANSSRNAEAVIEPPAVDNVNAINLTSTAKDVVIRGMKIDLTSAVYVTSGQRFLNDTSAPANSTLTLSNNIFTGGAGAVEGTIVHKTQTGNSTVTVTGNRFTNGGLSNGMFINNSGPSALLTLSITNNVWLDNGYTAGNFSTDNGATVSGNITNNWLGNSTPGTGGVDNYATRQAGFLFAGTYNGLNVKNNTFKDIEDVAIYFYATFNGVLNITDNVIDGYSNVPGRAAVLTSSGFPMADVGGVLFTNNSITNPTAGSLAVLNQWDMPVLDARGNWWGSANPDFNTLVNQSNAGGSEIFTVLVDNWLTSWGTPDVPEAGPALAETGTEVSIGTGAMALLMLLIGGAVVVVSRRRLQNG